MSERHDPSHELFQHYSRHYSAMERRARLPDDVERLKRDRLPRWIDEIPKEARILDAGCAEGHHLEALRRMGYTNLTGVELSAQLLATAKQRLAGAATLIQADIREWLKQAPSASFEVVFFHDVLEHLPREHTVDVLRQFYRILAPGGRLSVRLPNMASLIGGFNMALDFTHVTHFTEYSLIQVLEAAGFEPTNITLECQAPRLFWSWRKPHRALLRLLNRARWHLNNAVHCSVYLLSDFIRPRVFDPNLVVIARK
ncbi:MAG: methyltransferase domain-containing protein [Methylohalobius sp.]|nr:methyltransferase domain-containing protein [Methylohalobius sp.]